LAHPDDPARLAQAAGILRALADGGDGQAQTQLGVMYTFGHGVPADPEEGRFWLRQAALHGVREAQLNLGTLYARGIGTPEDPVQAWAWLSLAADGDHAIAARAQAEVAERLDAAALARARDEAARLREALGAP
ncbi:MAG: tetratricopeptide repeat protein, partial [Gammaproteobacteria bacterium]